MKRNMLFNQIYYSQTTSSNPIKEATRSILGTWKRPGCFMDVIRKLPAGSTVIDVGCGNGDFLEKLISWRGNLNAIGLDWTNVPPLGTIRFLRADATMLPIKDGIADLVVCRHLIEHLPDPGILLSELCRIMAPGGVLYLECPDARATYPFVKPSFYDDPTHLRPYTLSALERLVALVDLQLMKLGRLRSFKILLLAPVYFPIALLFKDRAFKHGFFIELFGLYIFALAKKRDMCLP